MNTDPSTQDGIAIIGIGCRYPGVHGPLGFLDLIRSDRSTVSAPPEGRIALGYDIDRYLDPRPRVPGKISSPYAGFLDEPEQFDPAPFGLMPRDVRAMEPQQRLMLEVTWDAFQDAGIPPDSLQGERVAVMIGHMIEDYSRERIAVLGEETVNRSLDVFTVMGMSRAALSGRISYLLGLTGPSLTLDTACSSSLITVHLACRSLWSGESRMALAGGVNLFVTAEGNIALSRSGMLSPDGACKAFDADANGFVRAEGAGIVLLRPLSDALSNRDPIYAVIRGTGVSTDGRDGGHMMAPGRQGQAQAMRDAYAQAQRSPADVDFVETHGTGTVIGDPVEIGALSDVMGPGRPLERPLRVSSIKGHIGHSESASGAAGLICASLSLAHRELPAQMHYQKPSPHIPWDEIPVRVQATPEPWPGEGPRLAGVNSFGISGTNAHVVLESAPSPEPLQDRDAEPLLVPLSAHDPSALEASIRQLRGLVAQEKPPALRDLAYTLGERRQHHRHRTAFVAEGHDQLIQEIDAHLAGRESGGSAAGLAKEPAERQLIMVFPGQGSQTQRMGQELLASEPQFRSTLESLDAAYARYTDWSLIDAIRNPDAVRPLERLSRLQPTLIAIEIGLAELWSHWGIRPDAVLGQSLGEIAAARIAGALDEETTARLACLRGRIVERAAGQGAMAMVVSEPTPLADRLAQWRGRIEIAGTTSPTSALIAGDREAIETFVAEAEAEHGFARLLDVDFASHCFHMDPLLSDFRTELGTLASQPTQIPFYSTVDGGLREGEALNAEYWVRNLRAPVSFSQTLGRALDDGFHQIVEVSPHPTLARAVPEIAAHRGTEVSFVPSLLRDRDERQSLLNSLAALYAQGHPVEFKRTGPPGQVLRTPPYPYQRQRFWFAERNRSHLQRPTHEWLDTRVDSADQPGLMIWETLLDADRCPFLPDYQIHGTAELPIAVLIEAAFAATRDAWPEDPFTIRNLQLWPPPRLNSENRLTLQITLQRKGKDAGDLTIMSRFDARESWSTRARMAIQLDPTPANAGEIQQTTEPTEPKAADDWYDSQRDHGVEIGRRMRTLRKLTRDDSSLTAEFMLPRIAESESHAYQAHPALLQGALSLCGPQGNPSVVHHIDEVRLFAPLPTDMQCEIVQDDSQTRLWIYDHERRLHASLQGIKTRPRQSGRPQNDPRANRLHAVHWQPEAKDDRQPEIRFRDWILGGTDQGILNELAAEIEKLGGRCHFQTDELTASASGLETDARPGLVWVGPSGHTATHSLQRLTQEALTQGYVPSIRWQFVLGSDHTLRTPSSRDSEQPLDFSLNSEAMPPIRSAHIQLGDQHTELGQMARWITERDDALWVGAWSDQIWIIQTDPTPWPATSPRTQAAGTRPFVASILEPGEPEGVSFIQADDDPPILGPHEIRIETETAHVRETALPPILGLPQPRATHSPDRIPAEILGRVIEVGHQVRLWSVDDRVLTTGHLARSLVLAETQAIALPETVPAAFATAHVRALADAQRILNDCPRLSNSRSQIWIHGGNRYPTPALVALAHSQGKKVLVSGATGARAARLNAQGAQLIDTTTESWEPQDPIDFVICLEDELPIDPQLSVIRPGGRLLNVTERETLGPSPVAGLQLSAGRSLVSLSLSDSKIDADLSAHPALSWAMACLPNLQDELFQPGQFAAADLSRAFHALAQGQAEAGLLLNFGQASQVPILGREGHPLFFQPEALYAIQAKTLTHAQTLAEWMHAHGAQRVWINPTREEIKKAGPIHSVITVHQNVETESSSTLKTATHPTPAPWTDLPDLESIIEIQLGLEALAGAAARSQTNDGNDHDRIPTTRLFLASNSAPSEIRDALESAYAQDLPQGSLIDPATFAKENLPTTEQSILSVLTPNTPALAQSSALRDSLTALSWDDRVDRILNRILDAVAVVMGVTEKDRESIRPNSALEALGLDSLMSLELTVGLQKDFALEFERGTVSPTQNLRSVAESIAHQLA